MCILGTRTPLPDYCLHPCGGFSKTLAKSIDMFHWSTWLVFSDKTIHQKCALWLCVCGGGMKVRMRVGRGGKEVISEGNGGRGRGRHCAEVDQTLVHTQ